LWSVERRATNVQRIKRQRCWVKNTERGYREAMQRGHAERV
jgi:hypothetical protein